MPSYKFNPLSGELDLVNQDGRIPEYATDPVSPAGQTAWVLRATTGGGGGGKIKAFMGLGFPYLTVGSATYSYELRYRTIENTTIGVALT